MMRTSGVTPVRPATRSEWSPPHQEARLDGPLRGLQHEVRALPADRVHTGAGEDAPAALLDQLRHLARHLHVVHDAGLRHVDGAHRAAVRLELAQLLGGEHLEAGEAVGLPALVDRLEPR
jgi:hypothetical protein